MCIKSTLPPVVVVVTNISYGDKDTSRAIQTDIGKDGILYEKKYCMKSSQNQCKKSEIIYWLPV